LHQGCVECALKYHYTLTANLLQKLKGVCINQIERNASKQNDLSFVLEIHGNAVAHDRLDLPKTPVWTLTVTNDGSYSEKV